ncbi:MAG TPA: hypothetical protein VGH87_08035 [Polyangiaceae bacterium]|nr:hypothetical protein [Polyangiaceae bacterium]
MRAFVLFAAVTACSNGQPPPLGDSDGAPPPYTDDAYAPPTFVDAGDAGAAEQLEFAGPCESQGLVPVWRFFDFQTHTPLDSALVMTAQTADTQAGLDAASYVELATVTGPDITTWTGVDVDTKLQSINEPSRYFLRVTITNKLASDGTTPVLVHYRQLYDCVVGQ